MEVSTHIIWNEWEFELKNCTIRDEFHLNPIVRSNGNLSLNHANPCMNEHGQGIPEDINGTGTQGSSLWTKLPYDGIQGPVGLTQIPELLKQSVVQVPDRVYDFVPRRNPIVVWDAKINKGGAPDLVKEPQMCKEGRPTAKLSRTAGSRSQSQMPHQSEQRPVSFRLLMFSLVCAKARARGTLRIPSLQAWTQVLNLPPTLQPNKILGLPYNVTRRIGTNMTTDLIQDIVFTNGKVAIPEPGKGTRGDPITSLGLNFEAAVGLVQTGNGDVNINATIVRKHEYLLQDYHSRPPSQAPVAKPESITGFMQISYPASATNSDHIQQSPLMSKGTRALHETWTNRVDPPSLGGMEVAYDRPPRPRPPCQWLKGACNNAFVMIPQGTDIHMGLQARPYGNAQGISMDQLSGLSMNVETNASKRDGLDTMKSSYANGPVPEEHVPNVQLSPVPVGSGPNEGLNLDESLDLDLA
ncbi:hypothetical protein BS47DRAFT_1365896 [Hydnum rufescens UP504]|uniref:Uncharacterized protein n=1 Tax=Hydnum rufescens UP504 TaxID=1448309 RepID=A0A9P6AMX2_9AGAM|nr:hypothetical protein BS47DRAFT_1365896 [Hydnum rufescens UP504]